LGTFFFGHPSCRVVGGVDEEGVDVEVESSGSVVVESAQLGPVWAADGDMALVVDVVVESISPVSSASAWSSPGFVVLVPALL
jgi:hypothetical protein